MTKLTDTHAIAIRLNEARWLKSYLANSLGATPVCDALSSAIGQIEGNPDAPEIAITITVYPTDAAYEEA